MIAIMWQFDVKDGRETEFEELYGADGEWTGNLLGAERARPVRADLVAALGPGLT
jgi:hypothetical protein